MAGAGDFLYKTMNFQFLFYFPLLAVPILLLLYFSGPLSAMGLTLLISLVGTLGIIFSAEDFFSEMGIGQRMVPFIFFLQIVWLWIIFWISEKLIEQKDMENHRLQEEGENLEISILDYQKEQKDLKKFCLSMKERILRYFQLGDFTDELASTVRLEDVRKRTEESVRKIFAGKSDVWARLDLLDFPNVPLKGDALSEWLVQRRMPLLILDSTQDLRFPSHNLRQNASILSCPIERENLMVGHLTLETNLPREWKEEDLRFLSDIADIVSVGVANAVYYEKVESLAVRDPLTGLYVRYRFDEKVEEEFTRAQVSGLPLALIFFDLDYFKKVNDRWGHLVGDEVLKSVAEIVLSETRETDFCARYGGEEIAVLMPRTQVRNSYLIAERIRKEVESHSIGPNKVRVTLSGGVAAFLPSMTTSQDLIKSADLALYQAKDAGRNRLIKVKV